MPKCMFRLVESIQIQNGQMPLLAYHEARIRQTRKVLLGIDKTLPISEAICNFGPFTEGLFKCRLVYNAQIEEIIVQPYQIRKITSIKLLEDNEITYDYKFLERPELDDLYDQRGNHDEIMIVRNGLVTDAYYYNFIFEKDGKWYTPASPLLKGCRRAALLEEGVLNKADITVQSIHEYDRIHLINAMTEPGKIVLTPDQIKA